MIVNPEAYDMIWFSQLFYHFKFIKWQISGDLKKGTLSVNLRPNIFTYIILHAQPCK